LERLEAGRENQESGNKKQEARGLNEFGSEKKPTFLGSLIFTACLQWG
jgi:hypothetical protein